MSTLRNATLRDLRTAAMWVTNQSETDLWTGGKVMYPIDFRQMMEAILWDDAVNLALGDTPLLAFGQILDKPDGRLHLARLIVDPERRGEGLGKDLVAGLLYEARARQPAVVSLNVHPENAYAIRLYERCGFHPATPSDGGTGPFIYMEAPGS